VSLYPQAHKMESARRKEAEKLTEELERNNRALAVRFDFLVSAT